MLNCGDQELKHWLAALACVLATSTPQVALAKCGGSSSFLEWFAWHPESKTVFLGTVTEEPQWTDRSQSNFNAIDFKVTRVLVGPKELEGSELHVRGGVCVNAAPNWKRGEVRLVGLEVFDGPMSFPVCAEAGLLVDNGIAFDRGKQQTGAVDDLERQFVRLAQRGMVDRRVERLESLAPLSLPFLLFLLAIWLKARDRRMHRKSLRRVGRLSLVRLTRAGGSLSCPTTRCSVTDQRRRVASAIPDVRRGLGLIFGVLT